MDIETAFSLADFINVNSSSDPTKRYRAGVFEYGQVIKKGWVIVTEGGSKNANNDNQSRRVNLEPITDVDDYLSRADRGIVQLDPEYYDLLHQWRLKGKQ